VIATTVGEGPRGKRHRLVRLSLDGKVTVLLERPDLMTAVAASPDGKRLAFVQYVFDTDVWMANGL
jgi:hypothetical protein